jgi:hypothetical protein
VARVVPHLRDPVNPLVGDPLVAVDDGAAEVEVPRVVVAGRVQIEPEERRSQGRLESIL